MPEPGCARNTSGTLAMPVMPTRSFVGSNATFLYSVWFTAIALPATSNVYPSGAERATNSLPMLLPAPALFSTMTVWPRRLPSGSASARAKMSVACPGGNGTMRRIGLSAGHAACATVATAMPLAAARPSSTRRRSKFKGILGMQRFLDNGWKLSKKKQISAGARAHRARGRAQFLPPWRGESPSPWRQSGSPALPARGCRPGAPRVP